MREEDKERREIEERINEAVATVASHPGAGTDDLYLMIDRRTMALMFQGAFSISNRRDGFQVYVANTDYGQVGCLKVLELPYPSIVLCRLGNNGQGWALDAPAPEEHYMGRWHT